jgi:hypothetical protein
MNFIFSLKFGVLKVVPKTAAQFASRLPLITPEILFVTFDRLLLLKLLVTALHNFQRCDLDLLLYRQTGT